MSQATTNSGLLEDFERDKSFNETQSTADNYVSNLEPFADWLEKEKEKRLDNAEKRDVQDYLNECEQERMGNKTIALRYTAISQFYQWLENNDRIEDSPTENLESGVDSSVTKKQQELRSDKPPAVTEEEKEKLCDNVPEPKVRNELMIRLVFQTGIRTKEMRNIRLQDLDREERAIRIEDAKSEKFRTVYYDELEPWMSQWLDHGHRDSMRGSTDSQYLFVTNRKEKLNPRIFSRIVAKAAESAGLREVMYIDAEGRERTRITPHALRHGFARYCVKNGMDISYLKDIMGHENLETTKQYLKFTDQDIKEAVRKHGPSPQ